MAPSSDKYCYEDLIPLHTKVAKDVKKLQIALLILCVFAIGVIAGVIVVKNNADELFTTLSTRETKQFDEHTITRCQNVSR